MTRSTRSSSAKQPKIDRSKEVERLLELSATLRRSDPRQAVTTATEATALADAIPSTELKAQGYHSIGIACRYAGELTRSLEALRTAESLAEECGLEQLVDDIRHMRAVVHHQNGDLREAFELTLENIRRFERSSDTTRTSSAYTTLANIYREIGDYPHALEYHLKTLRLAEHAGDIRRQSVIANNLGNVYLASENPKEALPFYRSAIERARSANDTYALSLAYSNLAQLYSFTSELELAEETAHEALHLSTQVGNQALAVTMLGVLGEVFSKSAQYDRAIERLQEVLEYGKSSGQILFELPARQALAEIYLLTKDLERAKAEATYVLEHAQKTQQKELEVQALKTLYQTAEQREDYREAYLLSQEYHRLQEELTGRERQKSLTLQKLRFDLDTLSKENEIYRLKSEQLEMEMDHRKKDLAMMTLYLNQKNELLDAVKQELQTVVRSTRGTGKGSTATISTMLSRLESHLRSDDDWQHIEEQFKLVNANFFSQLAARFPALTPTEIRVAALVKMNLSSKDIARLLHISLRAVETYRYRLRQKLELDQSTNLVSFLAGLETDAPN